MKKLFLIVAVISFISFSVLAQVNRGFNFQGIARDAAGATLANTGVDVKITIYPVGDVTNPVYSEEHSMTSDDFGLFQLTIGSISPVTFKDIDFNADLWMKVEVKTGIDPYETINNSQFLAVPYAKEAEHAVNADVATKVTGNGVPPGCMMAFAGPNVPDGWLVCDGSLVSRTTYAELFAVIGSAWGSGDGATTFAVPDTRGVFLRGQDNGASRDPNAGTRTAVNAGGNTGDAVGSYQAESVKTNFEIRNAAGRFQVTAGTGRNVFTPDLDSTQPTILKGDETRPNNVGVIYIVKY